jgi:hypothetical protein
MPTTKPPSGRTIVLELLKEMEERLYPLLYRTLPPGMYYVYLHPDDFRDIEPIVPLIVADAQQGLTARVDELNTRSRLTRLVSGRVPAIDAPETGWAVQIHPDANGELLPGELGIESRLSIPPPPRFDSGAPTLRIGRTVVTGNVRHGRPATVEAATSTPRPSTESGADTATTGPVDTATTGPVDTAAPAPPAAGGGTAQLAYVDDEGPHVFVVRKDLISIGRGGSAHWVDVQVAAPAKVSREHCRIRKTADGRYLLQDVSTWGTSVDGQAVQPFVRQVDGRVEQLGHEHELPPRARIQLADAVTIEFSVGA